VIRDRRSDHDRHLHSAPLVINPSARRIMIDTSATMADRGGPGIEDAWLTTAFDEAAPRYDLMVALNPGYHRELAAAASGLAAWVGTGGSQLVDLGCGSGASTRALLHAFHQQPRPVRILGVDTSAGMLRRARSKLWPSGVRFERCLAQDLADSGGELGLHEAVDGVFAAYLFRNLDLADRDRTLAAIYQVLRPGGALVVQEYSVAGSPLAGLVWTLVCWLVVIPLSWLTLRRTRLYRYLWRSVRRFESVQAFVDRLYAAGFVDVQLRTARGWQRGLLHTFRARRPDEPPAASQ
jgi:ubiquinone/menaquinone biosynthesis C-methylase UbiE